MKVGFCFIWSISIFLVCLPGLAFSQKEGIKFDPSASWNDVIAKAKSEDKFIFVDCFATWCQPCQFMNRAIFSTKEAGEFMNEHFVNVGVQMDQTPKDLQDVRNMYEVAKFLKSNFAVEQYPTYLFFSPDGKIVHRLVGATRDAKSFIERAKEALDPDRQYYTLIDKIALHLDDSSFLGNLLNNANITPDLDIRRNIINAYLSCVKDPFTPAKLDLVSHVRHSTDSNFTLFYSNALKVDSILGRRNYAEYEIAKTLFEEYVTPLFSRDSSSVDWKAVTTRLLEKYPALSEITVGLLSGRFEEEILNREIIIPVYEEGGDNVNWRSIAKGIATRYPGFDATRMIAREEYKFYASKEEWEKFGVAVLRYMKKYGGEVNKKELNAISWDYVFLHCDDKHLLSAAVDWSKSTIPDSNTVAYSKSGTTSEYIDTYANLLYKIGRREEAFYWEKKALDLSLNFSSDRYHKQLQVNFRETLRRMEQGEATWEGRNTRQNYE